MQRYITVHVNSHVKGSFYEKIINRKEESRDMKENRKRLLVYQVINYNEASVTKPGS